MQRMLNMKKMKDCLLLLSGSMNKTQKWKLSLKFISDSIVQKPGTIVLFIHIIKMWNAYIFVTFVYLITLKNNNWFGIVKNVNFTTHQGTKYTEMKKIS